MTRVRAGLLSASSAAILVALAASPVQAACTSDGSVVTCDASTPNPERIGLVATRARLLSGAIVQLDDPNAGPFVRTSTVEISAGGSLITDAGSQIYDVANGGTAVTAGAGAAIDHAGTITALRPNARGVLVGANGSLTVRAGGVIETLGNGSALAFQNASAAIAAGGNNSAITVNGIVRSSGSNAPAITTTSSSLFGPVTYMSVIDIGATGSVTTTGSSSNAVAIGGGSSLSVAGAVAVTGAGSSAITYQAGPAAAVTMSVLAGGAVTATQAAAITGAGANVDLTVAGTVSGPTAIALGAGADRIALVTGARVNGLIDGGAGTDALTLTGSGSGLLGSTANIETLTVSGGAWKVSGSQVYSGGTTIAAGATEIGTAAVLVGTFANGGTLAFDQATDSTFTGAITGTGGVVKSGSGTLTIGTQAYTGATSVAGGTMLLTGTLASSTYQVAQGAALTSARAATFSSTGPTLAITNNGTISNSAAAGRAIDVAGAANARSITLTNNAGALITSADDAFRINVSPIGGTIRVDNYGMIRTTSGGQALDFYAVASGSGIVINNYAGAELRSYGQDAIRPGQGAVVTNTGLIYADGAPNNSYDGIDWQGRSGTVINQATGTVSGLRHGITSDVDVNVTNAGTIVGRNGSGVGSDGTGTIVNTGTITGQWDGVATNGDGDGVDIDFIGSVTNSGTIQGLSAAGVDSGGRANSADGLAMGGGTIINNAGGAIYGAGTGILINHDTNAGGATTITNAGTIRGGGGNAIMLVGNFNDTISNSGSITGGNNGYAIQMGGGSDTLNVLPGSVITGLADGGAGADALVLHTIGARAAESAFDLSNFINFENLTVTDGGSLALAGTLVFPTVQLNGSELDVAAGTTLATSGPTTITGGDGRETVVNSGTIAGSIDLGGGDDRIENSGTITGNVFLGSGDDAFVERASATLVGNVDGGMGFDRLIVDATGGGEVNGDQFVNFESFTQTGLGNVTYSGNFNYDTIALNGGTITVAQGQTLASSGPTKITGGSGSERVVNNGTIMGAIDLDGGADSIVNNGRIGGAVAMGAGDDSFTDGVGSSVGGGVTGGDGNDTYRVVLAGDRTGIGMRSGFEQLAVDGTGTLHLTLDQNFQGVSLAGNGIDLATAGFSVGRITGSDGNEQVAVDRDVPSVVLGGGNDALSLGGTRFAGSYDGGAGTNSLRFTTAAPVTLSGTATGFESIALAGGSLTVEGTLGSAGSFLMFGDGDQTLTVASGGHLLGSIDLGAGSDSLRLATGFTGSVEGGAGNDSLVLSGGTTAAPIAFQTVSGFESLSMSAGLTTIARTAQLGRIDMSGGRLIGLAGSTIAAPQIAVGAGATFGSAGTVVGNLAVAGTLSPGASPETMTVTGNVSLASGSTTLFELTPTVSDKLEISGTLAIAGGTTLSLTGTRPLTPGAPLDLIVANGGISGSFATISRAATVLGFVRQSANAIQLYGQFANSGFNPQVTATINYVNAVLVGGQASAGLIAAVPSLLTSGSATNGAAFARLNPEAYASATQISIENGLMLGKAARAGAGTSRGDVPGAFTFAQGLAGWRSLNGSDASGVSRAELDGQGVLGGIGFGSASASLAGVVGYLDGRQRIPALAAHTNSSGIVAGLIGQVAAAGFDLSALLAYDGGKADTRRALPGGANTAARYSLHGWVSDISLGYALPLGANWSLKPVVGLTFVETRRGSATETGGGAFSLDVQGRRSHATFVDGSLALAGGNAAGATFHPWVSAGVRYQLNGQPTLATAGLSGTPATFSVPGVRRQATFATLAAGVAAELTRQLGLFAASQGELGKAGSGMALNGGLRLRF